MMMITLTMMTTTMMILIMMMVVMMMQIRDRSVAKPGLCIAVDSAYINFPSFVKHTRHHHHHHDFDDDNVFGRWWFVKSNKSKWCGRSLPVWKSWKFIRCLQHTTYKTTFPSMGKQKTDGSRSQMIENNFPLEHPSLGAGNRLDTKGMSNAQIFKVTRPRASCRILPYSD